MSTANQFRVEELVALTCPGVALKTVDKHPPVDYYRQTTRAGIAQLVEYELPKLGVAGSSPVARSTDCSS